MSASPGDRERIDNLAATTRLYICPFTPLLFRTFLPLTVQPLAQNVSFHTLETFPEKPYGYLDLPSSAAQSLKRKLNGTTIKGMKLRVEDARPSKRPREPLNNEDGGDAAGRGIGGDDQARGSKRTKQRGKAEDGVLPGVELAAGRKVKRGWEEAGGEKRKSKRAKGNGGKDKDNEDADASLENATLKFRTKLPANVASNVTEKENSALKKKKNKTKGKSVGKVEVKEFAKTSKTPNFLRSGGTSNKPSRAGSFVQGKGWVDEDGNLVEAVSSRTARVAKGDDQQNGPASTENEEQDSAKSNSDPSSESSDSESGGEQDGKSNATDDMPVMASTEQQVEASTSPQADADAALQSDTSPAPPSQPDNDDASKAVHPLEAIFKRPTFRSSPAAPTKPFSTTPRGVKNVPRPAPIKTSFSFFDDKESGAGGSGDEGEGEGADAATVDGRTVTTTIQLPPQTPFTMRDLEGRSVRSAAPTPDTAAIGKRFPLSWGRAASHDSRGAASSSSPAPADGGDEQADGEKDGGANAAGSPAARTAGQGPRPQTAEQGPRQQTEFEKHFYAHRGEYNRAWKARKREARKEARVDENRRRTRR